MMLRVVAEVVVGEGEEKAVGEAVAIALSSVLLPE
jgi:hypothetical protein